MSEALAAAEARFLAPANLTEVQLATQLGIMLRGDIDFADLYFQHAEQQAFVLEDGRVRDASFSIDHGVGLRAVAGAKTGFAYANGIDAASLKAAANAASAIADGRGAAGQAVSFTAAAGVPSSTLGKMPLHQSPMRRRRRGSEPSMPSPALLMRGSPRSAPAS